MNLSRKAIRVDGAHQVGVRSVDRLLQQPQVLNPTPKAPRAHILRLLGPNTILHEASGLI